MKKRYFIVFTVLLFLTAYLFVSSQKSNTIPEESKQEHRVSFVAAGDNLIHGAIFLQAKARANGNGYDFSTVYEHIAPLLGKYDLAWINQETLINDVYVPTTYPRFSTPAEMGAQLYKLGFRIFSLSNNHVYDYGAGGILATRKFWNTMPEDILTCGLIASNSDGTEEIPTYKKNGIVFAFLSYTEHTNGIPTPSNTTETVIYTKDEEKIEKQIRLARTIADFVIVAPHWGVEDSHTVTTAQRNLAQKMCSWGADVIIGTHPHVIQPIETLVDEQSGRKTLVAYSLGNFVSAQAKPDNLLGELLTFDAVKTDKSAYIENIAFVPIVTHYNQSCTNITIYPLSDYTSELAETHGIRGSYGKFGLAYIQAVFKQNISAEYLQ